MKRMVVYMVGILIPYIGLFAQDINRDKKYIFDHAKLAINEMELYKIPASITLAQGILETGNGQSDLAQYGNNHFGIKCKNEWQGERIFHDDDEKGECFRKYPSVEESYRDHSLFLAERPYYKSLFLLNPKDYKAWAYGLKKSGYATNPKYAPMLISIIEKYKLNQFDYISGQEIDAKLASLYPILFNENRLSSDKIRIQHNLLNSEDSYSKSIAEIEEISTMPVYNSVKVDKSETISVINLPSNMNKPSSRILIHPNGKLKYIIVKNGERLQDISKVYRITMQDLRKFNDLEPEKDIKDGQKVFLQRKRKKGIVSTYRILGNESLYDIAQNNGVILKEIYKRNALTSRYIPQRGEIILLKGKKY